MWKLLHLSDLHIGKRVNECSMLEDQRYILEQIAQLAIERKSGRGYCWRGISMTNRFHRQRL